MYRSLWDRWIIIVCPKSIILKTIDLEQVIEKAENIYNFYLDSNWEMPIYRIQKAPYNAKYRILPLW